MSSTVLTVGSVMFGVVAGYIAYRTLARTTASAHISDIAAALAAVGGGAVVVLFPKGTDAFGWYAIGLLGGMVLYPLSYWVLAGSGRRNEETRKVLGVDLGVERPPPG